ncbi:hypothetical protein TWF225_007158 [Orbilia oligospora]|uniref:Uncharacterized protein n=1 Tax=Orbilia oligospora TaxID=2813651 RepID=A0A7C8P6W5_ORBOL|nr:hypothetical protein TWF751_009624 [Orbilia oligospora]KAF3180795.1 hypothetical protein TWF225_007158 [Orbilia oligospora]KAF3234846.1 hypothetical protein TWF128_002201 [Orbilia oligospora]KAF3238806.1 hypothetical protein TWF217_001637 [Orbilia oligospora]KAF3287247.1 hypothetical protein TWF132_008616 [Orbilia oligospora]
MFFSKIFVCAIALAAPSLAALNTDQTAMTTKLTQMSNADYNTKTTYVDPLTTALLATYGSPIMSALAATPNDLGFVRSKGASGGPIATGMPTDASFITTSFSLWAGGHVSLMMSIKAKNVIFASSTLPLVMVSIMNAHIAGIISVSDQLQLMLPGSGYATSRTDVVTQANAVCKAIKEAIVSLGSSASGGANTCA